MPTPHCSRRHVGLRVGPKGNPIYLLNARSATAQHHHCLPPGQLQWAHWVNRGSGAVGTSLLITCEMSAAGAELCIHTSQPSRGVQQVQGQHRWVREAGWAQSPSSYPPNRDTGYLAGRVGPQAANKAGDMQRAAEPGGGAARHPAEPAGGKPSCHLAPRWAPAGLRAVVQSWMEPCGMAGRLELAWSPVRG